MTPNILEVMKWFPESSEFMWFDLGFVDAARFHAVTNTFNEGGIPVLLNSNVLPDEIPMPFEEIGIVMTMGVNDKPMLSAVTLARFDNTMQVVHRHPDGTKLVLTQVGERSMQARQGAIVEDLWYDGELFDRLLTRKPYKDKKNPEEEIVNTYSDIARRSYAMMYIELVNNKSKAPAYKAFPNPANDKRVAKGKKPLFEWRVIDVTANHILPEGGVSIARKHASPRRHVRRGHLRQYKSGKSLWIKQMMVGKIEFGYIHHSYTAQGEAA